MRPLPTFVSLMCSVGLTYVASSRTAKVLSVLMWLSSYPVRILWSMRLFFNMNARLFLVVEYEKNECNDPLRVIHQQNFIFQIVNTNSIFDTIKMKPSSSEHGGVEGVRSRAVGKQINLRYFSDGESVSTPNSRIHWFLFNMNSHMRCNIRRFSSTHICTLI